MSTTTRLDLATARSLTDELIRFLAPDCERIEIVGSVRRKRPAVKDIELLVEPRVEPLVTDLFGGTTDYVPLEGLIAKSIQAGVFAPRLDKNGRSALGERYKRLLYRGVPLDLFIRRDPAQWGVLMAIRTGPAEWSQRLVTQRRFGGYLPDGWRVHDGGIYDDQGTLRETPEERDVFELLELPWIEPQHRQ